MKSVFDLGRRFLHEEDGQDPVEYALLLGFVVLAAVTILPVMASSMRTMWQAVSNHLSHSASAAK